MTEPYATGVLRVDDGAELHWEESGNPEGTPMVWLHGGPGSGLGAGGYRDRPDPTRWRIIGLDQRACGRSTPWATAPGFDLATLTTQRMVADLDALRIDRGVDRWLVAGGSWGATLAQAYAHTHPDRVSAMALVAVTSGSRREVEWLTEDMGRVFPREWAEFAAASGRRPGQRVLEAYLERLTDPDPDVRLAAARAWCRWEDVHPSLDPTFRPGLSLEPDEVQQLFATHVVHNWVHHSFLGERGLLDDVARIGHVPAVLIHGRLDVSGPLDTAWELHRGWTASRLVVLESEGHGGVGMGAALAQAYADLHDAASR